MTIQREPGTWFTSSWSTDKADCVEVRLAAVVDVRDTKDRAGGQLAVTGSAWRAVLTTLGQ